MIKPILIWPDPRLKTVSKLVDATEIKTAEWDQLIIDMWETLYDSGGVGLAAIQIGVPKRVFVMDCGRTGLRWTCVNPSIQSHKGNKEKMNEGCLSLPSVVETMERWPKLTLTATDDKGKAFAADFDSIDAQCIQHELDHLDGVLISDTLSPFERERLAKRIKPRKKKT
jgi:peptide deformylase